MFFFFFNDTATTEIYTLSLHDALPIWSCIPKSRQRCIRNLSTSSKVSLSRSSAIRSRAVSFPSAFCRSRSEEHTSELQSQSNLVCRLLLEKKNITNADAHRHHALSSSR